MVAPDPEPAFAPEPGATVGLGEFAAILSRRWRVIAASTALTSGLALAYALVATPQYVASTAIFVDPRNRASFQIEGTGTGAGYDPNLVDSQTLVIESDAVLRRVIETEKLLEDPEFTRGAGEALGNALRNLKDALKVKRPDRTYVVEIQIRTRDAEKSARIANAVARAYLSDGRDSKSETATREASWLETRLAELQGRLREAEGKVDAYKAENRIIGAEGRLVGEQQLSELNRGLVDAQRKMAEAKAMLDQVEMLKKNGRLPDATPEALRSATIDRLRGQIAEIMRLEANARSTLGPRHPAAIEIREQAAEARRLLTEELNRISEAARSAYQVARSNVAGLERQLDQAKSETTTTNSKLLRLRELERAVDAQKAVYEKFLRDKEQIARLSVDTPAGRVIEPAVPPQAKSAPNRPLILALGFAAGLFAGVGLALVMETLGIGGNAPRRPSAPRGPGLIARLGQFARKPEPGLATPIAMLPAPGSSAARWLGRSKAPDGALDAVERAPNSAYAREINRIANRVRAALTGRESVTLMVSGTETLSGSPVLAANLARALALSGVDTLLVDGRGVAGGLAHRLAGQGQATRAVIAGASRAARRLASAGPGALLLLADIPRPGRAPAGPAIAPRVIVIDGPPLNSADLARIDLARRVDGVIALLPAGADLASPDLADALTRQFGRQLIGVVGQAA